MEKALLADPCTAANQHLAEIVTLQYGIVSDVDVVTDFDSFWMKHQHAGFNYDTLAESAELAPVARQLDALRAGIRQLG